MTSMEIFNVKLLKTFSHKTRLINMFNKKNTQKEFIVTRIQV